MDRQKVLELARTVYESDFSPAAEDRLLRFAALIEAQVCGDAEPVAYIGTDGSLGWLKKPDVIYSKAVPLFMHPAPAVDAEPVAWLVRNGVVDYQLVKRKEQAEHLVVELQKRHNLSGSLAAFNAAPLYTHPAPAVVRQLVEAAKRAMNYAENVVMAESVSFDYDDDLPFIESALLAAKEAGL